MRSRAPLAAVPGPCRWRRRRDRRAAHLRRARHVLRLAGGHEPRARLHPAARVNRLGDAAAFLLIQDGSDQIQLYIDRKGLAEEALEEIKGWDLWDIVAASGPLHKSGKGDLYVYLDDAHLLTKSLRPLPEKWHGLADQEQRYRQRYLDLIMNQESRDVFVMRSRIVQFIREFRDRIFHVHMKDVYWSSRPTKAGVFGGHVDFGHPDRDARPVDGGVFDVPAGAAEVIVTIDAKLAIARPTAFAVTLEKPGGVVVSDGPLLIVAPAG